jgi:breast cancer metastasis-suppressor 1-like protein
MNEMDFQIPNTLNFRLFRERMQQIEVKLEEVKAGRAQEYLSPLAQLQDNMRIRTQVAGTFQLNCLLAC